jgi:hypothetical protein
MPMLLTNPYFNCDSYLVNGGKLTELIIPAKEKRFWEAGAEKALATLSADDRPGARTRFARLIAFCERLGDRIGDTRIGDVMSEEEGQKVWRETASVTEHREQERGS